MASNPASRCHFLQSYTRGSPLDFQPSLQALRNPRFAGYWTEIFIHLTARGIPILPPPGEVAAEINRARDYFETKIAALS